MESRTVDLRGMFAGLVALAGLVVASPSYAVSKCVNANGEVTYTDTNCSRFGKPMAIHSSGMSYSSGEVTGSNVEYVRTLTGARAQREADDALLRGQRASEIDALRAHEAANASQEARRAAAQNTPLGFDTDRHTVATPPGYVVAPKR
jgi:hypothetical protein